MTDRLVMYCIRCKTRRVLTRTVEGPEVVIPHVCWVCQLDQLERDSDPPEAA